MNSNAVLTSRDIRRLDVNSESLGVSPLQLMENAGKAVANEIASRFKSGSTIMVLAGVGRNGGDGMVAARNLASMGYRVELGLIGSESDIKDEFVSLNWLALNEMSSSVKIRVFSDSSLLHPFIADVM